MYFLEKNLVCIYKKTCLRYLGDCFIFWTKSLKDLQDFQTIRNRLHDSVQFTMDINDSELPFLQMLIVKKRKKNYN